MNEIDKAAHDHATVMRGEDRSDVSDNVNFELMKQAFRAGHSHALSMANESFEEYWEKIPMQYLGGASFEEFSRNGWNQARLSCAKELAEKDKEIERLRKCCQDFCGDFNGMGRSALSVI